MRITARHAPWVSALLLAAAAMSPVAAEERRFGHQFALGAGASDAGGYFLFSWTSPKRVGLYFRLFPLMDDTAEPRPSTTDTEESAGEIGISVRANRWLTVGLGYAAYERTVITYGARDPYLGFIGEVANVTTTDRGVGALAIFALPSRSPGAAFALSASISTVGSGVAIGGTFGR